MYCYCQTKGRSYVIAILFRFVICEYQKKEYFCIPNICAVVAQLVEHWLPKPRVASSSLVYRSKSHRY